MVIYLQFWVTPMPHYLLWFKNKPCAAGAAEQDLVVQYFVLAKTTMYA